MIAKNEMVAEEIKSEVIAEIKRRGNYEVDVKTVLKSNVELTGISARRFGSSVAPTIYLESILDEVNKGELERDAVVNQFVDTLLSAIPEQDFDMEFIMDYEQARKLLSIRIINKEKNTKYLEDKVYKDSEYEGLVIVALVKVSVGGQDGSITVTKKILEQWGVEQEVVISDALAMAETNDPISNVNPFAGTGMFMPFDVYTNNNKVNGAAVITYPTFKKMIEDKYTDGAYIIPSSVHEVLLMQSASEFGSEYEVQSIKEIICVVNSSTLEAADYLSDKLYGIKDGEVYSF